MLVTQQGGFSSLEDAGITQHTILVVAVVLHRNMKFHVADATQSPIAIQTHKSGIISAFPVAD